jgi:4-hydroxy-2-oxoheptanedioate aldolase
MSTPPIVPDLRARLRGGDFLLGTWLSILDPVVAEIVAGCGYDLLVVDGEHGRVATSDLVAILIAIRASGVPVLYRVGANEPVRIMHALDAGASGVIIPQVRTPDDAARAVAWCRYPPDGLRGIGPRRASDYGRSGAVYLAMSNDLVTCCIQIETAEALGALDEILEVPGVDTVLVGPNDFAAALGHTGDLAHPDVEASIAHVLARAIAHGVPAGIWTPNPEVARARREQGFHWTTVGSDVEFLLDAAERAARESR